MRLIAPSVTFVGDDIELIVSIVNHGAEPITGTVTVELSPEPISHLEEKGDSVITYTRLAHGALHSKPIRLVALGGGELGVTLRLTNQTALSPQETDRGPIASLPAGPPETAAGGGPLLSHIVSVSPIPWLNRLRSWIAGALLGALGYLTLPWLKNLLKTWLPAN